MEDIWQFADELGPTKIIHVREPSAGLKALLVVDNVAAGPAIGGVRMAPDVTTEECVRLARAMTLKNAAASLAHGGAKVVLYGDPNMPKPDKERLIRALACALRDVKEYIFGPDMGTDEECMAWIKDEIGRAAGLPAEIGGIPLDEIGATGWGLSHVTDVALQLCGYFCDFKLEKARFVIQGFGAVGMSSRGPRNPAIPSPPFPRGWIPGFSPLSGCTKYPDIRLQHSLSVQPPPFRDFRTAQLVA